MLKFFGDGSDFDTKRGNSNAFYKKGDELILFDCGSKMYFNLIENDMLEGIKQVTIFITHLHAGHVGGLPQLADFLTAQKLFYNRDINYDVYYPNIENIKTLLDLALVIQPDSHLHKANESKYVKGIFEQKHAKNAYGYLFEIDGKRFYFSGDTAEINKDGLALLLENKVDYFYHEASASKNPYHVCLDELAEAIPENLRKKVYLMHINDKMVDRIKELGFCFCKTI